MPTAGQGLRGARTALVAPLPHGLSPTSGQLVPDASAALLIALAAVGAHRNRVAAVAGAGLLVLWGLALLEWWTPRRLDALAVRVDGQDPRPQDHGETGPP